MKAIIPAGGQGIRLLPMTKAVPKELFPIQGKPAIQWVLEEALSAGLREFIIVLGPSKDILRRYLTPLADDDPLRKHSGLAELEGLLREINIRFVEQPTPRGLGDALLRCRSVAGKGPFVLLLPDNVFSAESRLLTQLIDVYRTHGKSCVALWQSNRINLSDGAVIAKLQSDSDTIYNIERVFPKGVSGNKITKLRPLGRYILERNALEYLERSKNADRELDDVPLLDGLARDGLLLGMLTAETCCHIGSGGERRAISS